MMIIKAFEIHTFYDTVKRYGAKFRITVLFFCLIYYSEVLSLFKRSKKYNLKDL